MQAEISRGDNLGSCVSFLFSDSTSPCWKMKWKVFKQRRGQTAAATALKCISLVRLFSRHLLKFDFKSLLNPFFQDTAPWSEALADFFLIFLLFGLECSLTCIKIVTFGGLKIPKTVQMEVWVWIPLWALTFFFVRGSLISPTIVHRCDQNRTLMALQIIKATTENAAYRLYIFSTE